MTVGHHLHGKRPAALPLFRHQALALHDRISALPARILTLIATLVLAASAGAANAQSAVAELPNLPISLLGTWKVKAVLVDLGTARALHYKRDDPGLVGDRFTISDREIRSNTPESRNCPTPKVSVWKTASALLMAITFAPHGILSTPPTTKDFKLPIPPDRSVDAFFVKCDAGRFGPILRSSAMTAMGGQDLGTWIVILPGGDLALRWYDETILVLRRAN